MTLTPAALWNHLLAFMRLVGRAVGLGGSPAATPPVESSAPGSVVAAALVAPRIAELVPDDHRFSLVSQLFGAPVENLAGVRIGTIDNLIVDAATGRTVVALVMSAPEHGLPAVHLEVPWDSIINRGIDAPGVPYLVDLDADEVRQQRAQLAAET